jgi:hypothetical protein
VEYAAVSLAFLKWRLIISIVLPIQSAMNTLSPRDHHTVGPYSRKLRRGAIGASVDGRSAEGRFIRDLERQLVDHVGGEPSVLQRLLIDRLVKVRLQLDALDDKLAAGNWTPHDQRTYGALLNALRLTAREIGLQPAAVKGPNLADYLAAKEAAAAAGAAA